MLLSPRGVCTRCHIPEIHRASVIFGRCSRVQSVLDFDDPPFTHSSFSGVAISAERLYSERITEYGEEDEGYSLDVTGPWGCMSQAALKKRVYESYTPRGLKSWQKTMEELRQTGGAIPPPPPPPRSWMIQEPDMSNFPFGHMHLPYASDSHFKEYVVALLAKSILARCHPKNDSCMPCVT